MTKPNSFEVQDEPEKAVRTAADRIAKRTRRARREFNGTTRHLALDPEIIAELSKEGHLCWINDDLKGHIDYMLSIGYRFVTNREAYGERDGLNPEDRAKVRYGIANKENDPQDIYLMLQPWEFYNEDQEAMNTYADELDRQIRHGDDEEKNKLGDEFRKVQYKTNKH